MKPGSGTLIINIMSEGKAETYEGVYQCTARNERGAAISNNIVVRPSSKWDLSTNRGTFFKYSSETASITPSRYCYKKEMALIPIFWLCLPENYHSFPLSPKLLSLLLYQSSMSFTCKGQN